MWSFILVLALGGFSSGSPVYPSTQKSRLPISRSILNIKGHRFVSLDLSKSVTLVNKVELIMSFH